MVYCYLLTLQWNVWCLFSVSKLCSSQQILIIHHCLLFCVLGKLELKKTLNKKKEKIRIQVRFNDVLKPLYFC